MDTEPKGNSELLDDSVKENFNIDFLKVENNADDSLQEHDKKPPDGGLMAYSVVAGSFITNGLLFSVINSYSVIYDVLELQLRKGNVANSGSRASLVGALAMGTTFFLSPLSGFLTEFLGIRLTAVLGGSIAALGLILSSFIVEYVDALNFTYGILYGLGAALAYTPSLAILGHYFKKYLGIVNGIVCIGSPIFTVGMAPFMDYLIQNHGLQWMFRLLAVWTLGVALCGFLFRPVSLKAVDKTAKKNNNKMILQIWKNKKYRLWALSMPVALFGYFVPYVHLKKFIDLNFKDVNYNLPLQCISIGSGVGRLTFGFLADRPGIDRILLQQISFYVIGTFTIILPFMGQFWMVVLVSLGMGLCDGAFISLIGPIAIEICGSAFAAQAIGCMLGMAATPLCLGPPIAGYIFNASNSYTLPFVLAGISPIVGATCMFLIRFHGGKPINKNYDIHQCCRSHAGN